MAVCLGLVRIPTLLYTDTRRQPVPIWKETKLEKFPDGKSDGVHLVECNRENGIKFFPILLGAFYLPRAPHVSGGSAHRTYRYRLMGNRQERGFYALIWLPTFLIRAVRNYHFFSG